MRGYRKDGVVDAIRAAGGEIFAITSEPQSLANNAQEHWETGFEHIGDPHHEIMALCAERGWLSLFVNRWSDFLSKSSSASWHSHPKGYFQPGVLALRGDGGVLYRWRCRPTRKNIGGAIARPTATHVWEKVRAAIHAPTDAPDAPYDDDPVIDAANVPWAIFLLMLLSNGWFLQPVGFDQKTGEDTLGKRQRNALLRIPFFLAAWIAAFALLPLWAATLALAGWIGKVAPGIRMVQREFQNVGPNDVPG